MPNDLYDNYLFRTKNIFCLKQFTSYTFHVDFESPVFADLSISCNNPGEDFRT